MGADAPVSAGNLGEPPVLTAPVEHPPARSGDPSALSPDPGPPSPPALPSLHMPDDQSRTERNAIAVAIVSLPCLEPTVPGPTGATVGSQADLLEQIAGALRTAVARGDLDTARALNAVLAGALGVTQPPDEASGARVIPLRGRGKPGA